jgi:phosphatidate cytidylyltransferase
VRQRVISAAVLVPAVLVVFLLGNPWLTLGVAVVSVFAAYEAFWLLRQAGWTGEPFAGIIAAPIAILATLPPVDGVFYLCFVPAVLIISAMVAFRQPETWEGFILWAASTFGALYVSLLAFIPGVMLVAPSIPAGNAFAGVLDAGRVWLLILVLCVWTFDTFAYLSGRTFKRGRFMNHISPNKTWSGVVGGLVAAMAVGAALTWAAGQGPVVGVALGALIAVAAQTGDLAESLLKRAGDTKDSGNLIPGHGGILDRVDSLLFAAPTMFTFLVVLDRLT